jgi:hypothetical protein
MIVTLEKFDGKELSLPVSFLCSFLSKMGDQNTRTYAYIHATTNVLSDE